MVFEQYLSEMNTQRIGLLWKIATQKSSHSKFPTKHKDSEAAILCDRCIVTL